MSEDETRASSTAAAVTRELLRTPAFKQLLRVNLRPDGWEDSGRQLARTLATEDVEVSMAVASSAPRAVNALARALVEAGRAAEGYPPQLLRAYAAQLLDELDADALGELVTVYGGLLRRLLLEDEQTRARVLSWLAERANELARRATEADGEALPARDLAVHLLRRMDWGLVRRAVEAVSERAARRLPALLEQVAGDPVLLANLLESLPPVANAALALGARGLTAVKLPPEVLASGVFNLLQELDTASLAALLDALSATVQSLHAGSLLLGRHEPRFRAVLTKLLEQLLSAVDHEAAAGAALALAEDAETLLQALADVVVRDPRLLPRAVSTGVACAAAVQGGAADALEALDRLPDEALDEAGAALEAGDWSAAARAVNAGARLCERVLARREALPDRLTGTLLEELDLALLRRVAARLAAPLWRPTELLEDALGRYVEAVEANPRLAGEVLDRVDPALLARALELARGQLELVLRERPELVHELLAPLVARLPFWILTYFRERLLPTSAAGATR